MKFHLIAGTVILLLGATYAPFTSTRAAPLAAEPLTAPQAQATDFKRPDVAPLPAEGKFQVVSDSAWPGDKVRVFFLGAQF